MKPFEDIFDVLNKARQNKDKVTITFIKGLDNIARLQIEDSSATAGTTRYVKFYNNDIRKFHYVDQSDFEEMYAGLEMKAGTPKEETIEFPSEEVGIISALKILQQSGVFSDEDGITTLTIKPSTLKEVHYMQQYIEPAIERYFNSLDRDVEELDRVLIDQSEELIHQIWEKFDFSEENFENMLAKFESTTLDTFTNVPSNMIIQACSEVNRILKASVLHEDVEDYSADCNEALVEGLAFAFSRIEQFIVSIATLPYRRTELELRESRETYIKELATNLFIFADAVAQVYTRLVCSNLVENNGLLKDKDITTYLQAIDKEAVYWVKQEALSGTLLASHKEDVAELPQALNSMSLESIREFRKKTEEEELAGAITELIDELMNAFDEDESEDGDSNESILTELENAFSEAVEAINTILGEESEEEAESDVPFETPMVDMDDLLGTLLKEEPVEEPVELSDEAKAEFEDYFADEIYELQELRKKVEDALTMYDKVTGELALNELDSVAMGNIQLAISTLRRALDNTELDYTKKGLLESLATLKGDKHTFYVESISILGDAYELYKTLGVGITDYAHAVVEDIECSVANKWSTNPETQFVLSTVTRLIEREIEALEDVEEYSDLLAFSLALSLTAVLADWNNSFGVVNVDVNDFIPKKRPSVVVEEDEEEETTDLAKELKDLIRGTALDADTQSASDIDEEALIADYKNGVSQRELTKCYNISTGKFYSILRRHGIAVDSSKVAKKVAHVEENPEVLERVLKDYIEGKTLAYIYSNYNLYKNGLFYLLDKYQVPRRNKR